MLEDRTSKLKSLMARREAIDAELASLLGVQPTKPRGRPPKPENLPDPDDQNSEAGA